MRSTGSSRRNRDHCRFRARGRRPGTRGGGPIRGCRRYTPEFSGGDREGPEGEPRSTEWRAWGRGTVGAPEPKFKGEAVRGAASHGRLRSAEEEPAAARPGQRPQITGVCLWPSRAERAAGKAQTVAPVSAGQARIGRSHHRSGANANGRLGVRPARPHHPSPINTPSACHPQGRSWPASPPAWKGGRDAPFLPRKPSR